MRHGWITSPSVRLLDYISGWETANSSSDPTNDIDFGAGVCWINDHLVESSSIITKRLDAAWQAGNNQGGSVVGSKANSTWYHCFAMFNPSTGAIDACFDTSVTGTNAPSGWVVRRVWSVQTRSDGSIRPYTQTGDRCTWRDSTFYSSTGAIGNTARILIVLTVPTGIQVEPLIVIFYSGSNADYLWCTSPQNQNDGQADYTIGQIHVQCSSVAPLGTVRLLTDTSGRIGVREALGNANNSLWISCAGYIDARGKR
ncbi:hypothetical protein [Pantanalinema sp. GBBB05]|uniref:hypothetical protein n=1 Tax=Pantanalinema sp. GBBB05 TaxID=2604139 RepID=UPI001D6B8D0A|nr:hypothetical protein [Pantanalinema sp. GBBB05]